MRTLAGWHFALERTQQHRGRFLSYIIAYNNGTDAINGWQGVPLSHAVCSMVLPHVVGRHNFANML